MSARELDLYENVGMIAARMPGELFTKPDDDWTPAAFLQDDDGNVSGPIGLAEFMESQHSKDMLAETALPLVIRMFAARSIVMVLSIWSARIPKEEATEYLAGAYVAPSERPDREEKLMLIELKAEGVTRHSFAPIIRHEDAPPTLGEWEEIEGVDRFAGRFVDPLVAALKSVEP